MKGDNIAIAYVLVAKGSGEVDASSRRHGIATKRDAGEGRMLIQGTNNGREGLNVVEKSIRVAIH